MLTARKSASRVASVQRLRRAPRLPSARKMLLARVSAPRPVTARKTLLARASALRQRIVTKSARNKFRLYIKQNILSH